VLNIENSSFINRGRDWFIANNPDNRQMFLSIQIIPIPLSHCYSSREQCDMSIWDTTYQISYTNDRISDKIIVDTSSCWNWWNVTATTDPTYEWWDIFHLFPIAGSISQADMLFQREENKTLCSVVIIPFTPDDGYFNISFDMSASLTGKAKPNLNIRVFDFSTAYADRPIRYSSTADMSLANITELVNIQFNVTRLLYYSVIIALIVFGVLAFVGGIPIIIRWIISKVVR
jgi:hypothetical protein